VSPLVARASRRHFVRHPGQLALGLFGLALGVAVVVAIHTTRESARAAFDLTSAQLAGRATHRITGGSAGVPFTLFARLRTEFGVDASAPAIEARVTVPDRQDRSLSLLAVDPLSELRLRPAFGGAADATLDAADLMTRPGAAWVSASTARRLGLERGEAFGVRHAGKDHVLHVAGIATADGDAPAPIPDSTLVVDLATGEEVLGTRSRLSRIDLVFDRTSRMDAEALEPRLPAGVTLASIDAATPDLAELTRAFYTNLTALGLLAVLVGMFLVFSTQTFLVTQRRELYGTLRAIGATRAQIAFVVLGEAVALGAVGGLVGVGLGYGLSHVMLSSVALTLSDLYYDVAVSALTLPWSLALGAVALGIAAAVGASLAAIATAGGTPVRHMARMDLERRAAVGARYAAFAGVGLALAAWPVVALTGRSLLGGFAGLFSFALGAALVTPAIVAWLTRILARSGLARGFAPKHAVRLAAGSLSRTGVATAALMLAAATGIGVTTMIASFRVSVDDWLTGLLRADLYVSIDGADRALGGGAFDRATVAAIEAAPAVAHVTTVRRVEAQLVVGSARAPEAVAVVAYRLHRRAFDGFDFVAGKAERAWGRWPDDDSVLVSEPFAWHHALAPGDEIVLATPSGTRRFELAGVYRDYGSERGAVAMSHTTFARWFGDPSADGLGLYGVPGADSGALRTAAAAALDPSLAWSATDARRIRARSLEVFDRTFVVTSVMRNLALAIACAGMISSLMALGLERARVFATYRALGTGTSALVAMLVAEAGTLGLAAATIAVPAGLGLALGLIEVINVRSFGWSMHFTVPVTGVVTIVAVAVAAALAAGLYPAWQAARRPLAEALRGE